MFFFFQAEDGIRDGRVTGVQTCALPIYAAAKRGGELAALAAFGDRAVLARAGLILGPYELVGRMPWWLGRIERGGDVRSEERRVGKECRSRGVRYVELRDSDGILLSLGM